LGGVIISLTGVAEYQDRGRGPVTKGIWDPSYRYWHWMRPFVGATVALIAILVFQSGVLAIGASTDDLTTTALFYYVVAFVVGYREQTFRELIKKVADVILTPPGSSAPTITGADLTPNGAIEVTGSGFVDLKVVKIGGSKVDYARSSDTKLVVHPPDELPRAALIQVETKHGEAGYAVPV
jgi:hypothetical protein